ncbi:MAG: cytochrome P450 [Trueperaceae bacterium]
MSGAALPLPSPAGQPVVGHLGRWGREPLALLGDGARLGRVFELRLWRRAVVGYGPEWNRLVLGDLDTFRSKGSLSALSPYLNGGVVMTDHPEHAPRRQELNPHFHAGSVATMRERLVAVVAGELPAGRFDTLAWALHVVPPMLNEAFFAGEFPQPLLEKFVAPLHRPLPWPLLPRPATFRQVDAAIARVLAAPGDGSLAHALAGVDGAGEELRVALAAAFDTTAHTLAWALWHLAGTPNDGTPDEVRAVVQETLRLYPAGWLGSRVASRPFSYAGHAFPRRLLVFYSPYLTHRDADLWPDPDRFDPTRFQERKPPWGYIPFSAGERTCLGMHLANLILEVALTPFAAGRAKAVGGDPTPRTGLTLSPRGPLWVDVVGSLPRHV